MKKFAIITVLVMFTFLFAGCTTSHANPEGTHHNIYIDRVNFWRYLTINRVQVNPVVGTRLQIFPNNTDFIFNAVTITYMVYPTPQCAHPEQRMMQVNRNGRGESHPCTQLFPRIVSITGSVEFWR